MFKNDLMSKSHTPEYPYMWCFEIDLAVSVVVIGFQIDALAHDNEYTTCRDILVCVTWTWVILEHVPSPTLVPILFFLPVSHPYIS